MKYFLDTNIIIYAAKGMFPVLIDRFTEHRPEEIFIPAIVSSEIEYGARKSIDYVTMMSKYRNFLSLFSVVSFSEKAAYCSGIIRSDLEKKGTPIGVYDTLIAGTVIANDGVLVTHNVNEFRRVEGLRVEDWTQDQK